MENEFLLLISVVILFSSFVQGSIGFGFPLVTTTILALFMDIQTAIFFTLIPSTYLNIASIRSEGHFWEAVKSYYSFALLMMFGVGIGLYILLQYETSFFKLLLALTIYMYLFFNKLHINMSFVREKPRFAKYFFGLFSGFIGGLTNASGPPYLIYALEAKLDKATLIQMGNVSFLGMKVAQFALFFWYGKLSQIELDFSIFILIGVAFMFYFGNKLRDKMPLEIYRKVIKILLFIIATVLIFKI